MSEMSDQAGYGGMDDGRSAVGGPERRQIRSGYKMAIAGVVLVIFMAFIWIGGHTRAKHVDTAPQNPVLDSSAAFKAPPILPPAPPPARVIAHAAPMLEAAGADAPIFAFTSGTDTATPVPANHAPLAGGDAGIAGGPPGVTLAASSQNALTARLQPSPVQISKAELLPHPDMMMTQGTIIPCTLQTAINTELPGYVKCVLPDDVRGTTGNVVLLDRGTTVIGEIQHGLLQGENRVFILWDRAETPEHVMITLASPGTDELGRSGVPGGVNTHFWQRFGAAIMLSVIQGGLQTGTALAANSGGSGVAINSFSSNGEQLSDTALRASISMAPTLEKNQGDNVAIFVAKDLDFSDVYSLRPSN